MRRASCLKRRNPDADALERQITAYETQRFVERAGLVGVEVVQYQPDHLGIRVCLVHQPPHLEATVLNVKKNDPLLPGLSSTGRHA